MLLRPFNATFTTSKDDNDNDNDDKFPPDDDVPSMFENDADNEDDEDDNNVPCFNDADSEEDVDDGVDELDGLSTDVQDTLLKQTAIV